MATFTNYVKPTYGENPKTSMVKRWTYIT